MIPKFQNYLNTLIPDIEITFEYSETKLSFLDVELYIINKRINTKTFFKETDTHQLLHTQSYHPKHIWEGILKSQLIRFKRLSSTYNDYNTTSNLLFSYLKNRGYGSAVFRKLKFKIWHEYNGNNFRPNNTGIIPIIMNYSTLGQKLTTKYRNLIKDNELLQNFKTLSAYTMAPNLKQLLVRSDFNTNRNTPTKSDNNNNNNNEFTKCCSKKCQMCTYFTENKNKITSSTNKKTFSIVGKMTCQSKHVVYSITCIKCKLQYVGETGQHLKDRLIHHLSDIKTKKATAISIHFNSPAHSKFDLRIVGIEQI